MHFRYTPVPDWPPLAWLACGHRGDPTVEVFHGPDVETTPDGFSEAVWDGEFARAGFDETDLVFGSGARRRGGSVTFVSSGSTVDRLHSHEAAGRVCVANSLACLLVAIGADVDPTYAGYYADFKSISDGLARYARSVATSAGPVRLTYFHNLVWDGRALRERPKPAPHRDFGDFAAYRGFLEASLAGLAQNLSSSDRAVPLRMLGTISSGYDSPAVTVLAQPYGLQEAIAFEPSSSGAPDSGGAIAHALGMRLRRLARDAWRGPDAPPGPELPFLAADAKGEDVYFRGAEAHLARRVLVTGYHGDQMWSKRPRAASADIVRGDQSGLSLSEYRLWAGFIHLPVPFLGVRQIGDVSALSRSSAMAPWDVPGAYSRPICRRIVETAGVPRDAFGVRKQTASVLFFERDDVLSPGSLAEYGEWLREHAADWSERGLAPPARSPGAAARPPPGSARPSTCAARPTSSASPISARSAFRTSGSTLSPSPRSSRRSSASSGKCSRRSSTASTGATSTAITRSCSRPCSSPPGLPSLRSRRCTPTTPPAAPNGGFPVASCPTPGWTSRRHSSRSWPRWRATRASCGRIRTPARSRRCATVPGHGVTSSVWRPPRCS